MKLKILASFIHRKSIKSQTLFDNIPKIPTINAVFKAHLKSNIKNMILNPIDIINTVFAELLFDAFIV